jgi:hypothetical protein
MKILPAEGRRLLPFSLYVSLKRFSVFSLFLSIAGSLSNFLSFFLLRGIFQTWNFEQGNPHLPPPRLPPPAPLPVALPPPHILIYIFESFVVTWVMLRF